MDMGKSKYNRNKAQQSKNRVHISWDILYVAPKLLSEYYINEITYVIINLINELYIRMEIGKQMCEKKIKNISCGA